MELSDSEQTPMTSPLATKTKAKPTSKSNIAKAREQKIYRANKIDAELEFIKQQQSEILASLKEKPSAKKKKIIVEESEEEEEIIYVKKPSMKRVQKTNISNQAHTSAKLEHYEESDADGEARRIAQQLRAYYGID
jgi:hypothetical protein